MAITPSASYSLTIRAAIKNRPGMLGLLTDAMAWAATIFIASAVSRKELHEEYVIPSVFNKKVAPAVAREVVRAAQSRGLARRRRRAAQS